MMILSHIKDGKNLTASTDIHVEQTFRDKVEQNQVTGFILILLLKHGTPTSCTD